MLISCGDNKRKEFLEKTIKEEYSNKVVTGVKETSAEDSGNTGSIYVDVTFSEDAVRDTVNYSKIVDGIYFATN